MPNIKSAKKRVTVIARRKEENRFVKSTLATYIKNFRLLVTAGELEQAEKLLPQVVSYIDNAQTKGVIHKNTAARKVARLNVMLYKAKHETAAPVVEEKVEKVEKKAEVVAEEVKPAKTAKTTKKAEATEEKVTPKKRATKKAE